MMTQTEIANRAGVTPQFIHLILKGVRRPSWSVAKKLAEVTGIDAVHWMEGDIERIKQAIQTPKGEAVCTI